MSKSKINETKFVGLAKQQIPCCKYGVQNFTELHNYVGGAALLNDVRIGEIVTKIDIFKFKIWNLQGKQGKLRDE